jgi:hypothetical protein
MCEQKAKKKGGGGDFISQAPVGVYIYIYIGIILHVAILLATYCTHVRFYGTN